MRFVELTVPIGQRDATIRELDSEGIDELSEQEAAGERIAREELRTEAENLAPARRTYVTMTVVSAVIATAGLLLDSPAVIVGSMVIAPLIGPAMAASVGTVIDDRDLFVRGVQLQALGLGLAWGQPIVSLGAGILLLVNVLSINLAALVVLWATGYRPQDLFRLDEAQTATAKRVGILVAAIAVLSVFLGGVTYPSYQSTVFEQEAETELTEMLDEPPYERLTLLDSTLDSAETTVAFDEVGFASGEPSRVVVTIDRPADSEYPRLAEAIDRRLSRETRREVAVEVRFVDAERTT